MWGKNEVDDSRCGAFVEGFEHGLWYKPARACDRVMCLVPGTTLVDLADDIEKVALLKGELLRSWGAITACRADDFLRRGYGGRGPRDWRQGSGDIGLGRVRILVVEGFPESLHGYGRGVRGGCEGERADQPRWEERGKGVIRYAQIVERTAD
jgi:hypothetical protein